MNINKVTDTTLRIIMNGDAHYVGRKNKSKRLENSALANPFSLQMGRYACCAAYFEYFEKIIYGVTPENAIAILTFQRKSHYQVSSQFKTPTRDEFMAELNDLSADDTIVCWCIRKRFDRTSKNAFMCHAETIAQHVVNK